MIRKIVLIGLLAIAAYFFYQKFMAQTFNPFFKEKQGNVDFMSLTTPALNKADNATETNR